jgi:transposase
MLMLPSLMRVFICREPTDMRKSFDGLSSQCRNVLGQDPASGHLFVFFNRSRNQVRILVWDRTGWAIWAKRLEQGRFQIAQNAEIGASDLSLILEGIDLTKARRRKRFVHLPDLSNAA